MTSRVCATARRRGGGKPEEGHSRRSAGLGSALGAPPWRKWAGLGIERGRLATLGRPPPPPLLGPPLPWLGWGGLRGLSHLRGRGGGGNERDLGRPGVPGGRVTCFSAVLSRIKEVILKGYQGLFAESQEIFTNIAGLSEDRLYLIHEPCAIMGKIGRGVL